MRLLCITLTNLFRLQPDSPPTPRVWYSGKTLRRLLGRTESRRSGSFSFETVVSELILSKHKKSDPRKKTPPVKGFVNVSPAETFHQLSLVLTAARVLP